MRASIPYFSECGRLLEAQFSGEYPDCFVLVFQDEYGVNRSLRFWDCTNAKSAAHAINEALEKEPAE